MERPYLIQRCEITGEKLRYDYMGSSEFEWGACPASLKRIFAAGLSETRSSVTLAGQEVEIFFITGAGFNLEEYQPYLQQLADNAIRLKEWSNFDAALKQHLGIPLDWQRSNKTNGWFDIQNDVLWVLTQKDQGVLSSALHTIKEK